MKKKRILFRADGNTNTGLGHLYRLFALVEIYKPLFEVVFITKKSSTIEIIPQSYRPFLMPDDISIDHEAEWLSSQFNATQDIIIADGYQFNSDYQKRIKKQGFKLIYIDDLIEGTTYADVLINHTANISTSQYQTSVKTHFALGTDYAILRPSFVKASQKSREITDIKEAFVCFGGADTLDLSLKATLALMQIPQIESIHVVVGAAYRHTDIFELYKNHEMLQIYQNLDEANLCLLMYRCQLAIAPASTIVYELCSVKLPIFSGYFVDNQKNIYEALLRAGAIYGGDDMSSYSVLDFKKRLEDMLTQNKTVTYLKAQEELFDGQSANRLLGLINSLCITFRKATEEDMMMVYNWSNDPVVRQNSYDSNSIVLEDHNAWFSNKIQDEESLFFITLYDGQPAGIVRYDIKDGNAVVGILIAEEFRGKKLSSSILRESAKQYFKQNNLPIFAYIKEANKSSIKAFQNAGYSYYKKDIVKGIPSFVYKLEINDN